jgi:hypothetical protein
MGLLAALLGAWAGIVAFVGPEFGYRPTSAASWQWTTANWLLHLVPGAVAVGAGLVVLAMARAVTPASRGLLRLAALCIVCAGAWLVVGPALWPVFESGRPYAAAASAQMSFTHQIGANLGPGILLVLLGGMIFEAVGAAPAYDPAYDGAGGARRAVETSRVEEPADGRLVEPADRRVVEPVDRRIDEPADRRGAEPTEGRLVEPADAPAAERGPTTQ